MPGGAAQVLGYLRAAHARGRALGRLRPAALRVTASRIVLLDPSAAIPSEEEALYAGALLPPTPCRAPGCPVHPRLLAEAPAEAHVSALQEWRLGGVSSV